jgi:hypothetical protein
MTAKMELHQIVLTSQRDRRLPLFTKEHHYLEALHRLGRVCKGNLALFALIAEHLHLIALLSRTAAGRLAQAVLVTLRPLAKTPLATSYIDEVDGRGHSYRSVKYELQQPQKHGMPGPGALWPGSCLPELVGARVIPGLTLRLREALPTFQVKQALRVLDLPGDKILPAGRQQLRAAGAARLIAATAATLGVEPTLRGNSAPVITARRAVAHIAARLDLPPTELRSVVGKDRNTLWRLRRRPVSSECIDAIRRRVALEDLVQHVIGSTAQGR